MKKYLDIIVINIMFLLVGIALFFLTNERVEILAAVIATGISLSLGIRHSKTENDKLFKELFVEFNSKYDEKFNDELENIIISHEKNREYKMNEDQRKTVVDYINFCAEEYLWKTKGGIPDLVWNSWENGMVYYLNNPVINKIVVKEKEQMNSFYGLFNQLENRVSNIK